MTAITVSTRLRHGPDVLFRNLDGEAVLVHLGSGTYFGLDEVGTCIWEWIASDVTLDQVLDRILETYEVERDRAWGDLERLVGELLEQGLVEVVPAA